MKNRIIVCPVCGLPIERGTGTRFAGRLIHLNCVPMAKMIWFRLKRR